jgi:hypothetical protein
MRWTVNPDTLGDMSVDNAAAALLLVSSMRSLANKAATEQVGEAAKQGVVVADQDITDDDVRPVAEGMTAAMASSTVAAAGRTAAQALGTGDGAHVADDAIAHLAGLADRFLRDQLGGALSAAMHLGRTATFADYPGSVDYYASERADVERVCSVPGRRRPAVRHAGRRGRGLRRWQVLRMPGRGPMPRAAHRRLRFRPGSSPDHHPNQSGRADACRRQGVGVR